MFRIRTYSFLILALSPSLPLIATTMTLPQGPLQSKGYVAPNVMLLMDTSGSMKEEIAGTKRIDIAKNAAIEVIRGNPDIRFCLSRFNSNSNGGEILEECKLPLTSTGQDGPIFAKINALPASGGTPLAESYYEVIRYFAGKPSAYNSRSTTRASPIQYRCQKNFTVVLTDGQATNDSYYPYLSEMNAVLPITGPNYDGIDNDLTANSAYGYNNYLDDFAKYAWDADFKPNAADLDEAGESYEDPKIVAGGEAGRQNMYTYTIGFEINNDMLVDASVYGNGSFQRADSAVDLANTFNSAIDSISSKSQSISAIASSSNFITSGTDLNVYQSRYVASTWTGELVAWTLNGTTLQLSATPAWTAPQVSPDDFGDRVIFSGYNNGIVFRNGNFSSSDRKAWFRQDGFNLIPYLRGRYNTDDVNNDLRPRDSLLGDIINSSPVYVAPPLQGAFRDDAFSGETYSDFVTKYKDRTKMLFVGANDGMLHGYNAADGSELLGYYPSAVLPNLKKLVDPDYDHQFYVDGTPTVGTVYDDTTGTWRTLLVGGLRRGGQSIYALDVSNPGLFISGDKSAGKASAAEVVRWEFGDTNDKDMGYSYSQPKTMRLNDGKFYVVVGNGYNSTEVDGNASTTGDAVLYLLNVEDGSFDSNKKISTLVGTAEDPTGRGIGNGLSTVTGFDKNNDGKIDYLYGGDLFGNVWKFDVNDPDSDKWGSVTKLFTACGGATCQTGTINNNHQPITSPIEVVKTEYGKTMLFFGTGKLLEVPDSVTTNVPKQSFYGLIDYNSTPITSRSQLLEQKIIYSGKPTIGGITLTTEVRVTTNKKITTQKGWFMDIQVPSYASADTLQNIVNQQTSVIPVYSTHGEQVLAKARYSKGVISFFTKAVSNQDHDPCADISSSSFAMELNALSGSRLGTVRSDVNEDGVVDEKDSIDSGKENTLGEKVFVVVSGKAGGNGSGSLDITVTDGNKTTDKVISINGPNDDGGSSDGVTKIIKTGYRASWREITND